jgi:glutamine synthetase
LYQEDTDRNRTSPYAYTGNKFEFRAAGSSQNPSFIMATIAATIAHEVNIVTERLEKGETVEAIIADLHAKTQQIRFEGNGYSAEWPIEAEKRGLYVNRKFSELLTSLGEAS